ncbi:MAG: circularly permuted type 2 ATP-grasp protein [Steroidobacteraceae bacterium]
MKTNWSTYPANGLHDELVGPGGGPRAAARALFGHLSELDGEEIAVRQQALEVAIRTMGITFTVYHEQNGSIDRAWPLDIMPRIISRKEWQRIEKGLVQRAAALNLFIDDVYHDQKFIRDGRMPGEIIHTSKNFRAYCSGIKPPLGVWAHICGSDLIRDKNGTVYVLEDNLRVPSGVSYMLENRQVIKRVFPEVFENSTILPVDDYPLQLYDTLAALSPRKQGRPEVVVLTPGIYNSAYFEHSYLARQMGCELVEGRDLAVDSDDCVYMQTVDGWARVDVIYRRIDDDFLDPDVFREDSTLGVPGIMRAWKKGNVALANAPGAGVADDKLVYTYVPDMIKYYLDEDPILDNVPSWRCAEPKHLKHVLANLNQLVVKPVDGSGGYGMLMGPMASRAERDKFARALKADPRSFVAQPVITLSTVPTLVGDVFEPRHVDLRPFILSGPQTSVTMGGLTRVALRKGSLVVNSSQGGGSKDTWIVDTEA